MDELLLLAFLFWIFKAIAKKGKGKTKHKQFAINVLHKGIEVKDKIKHNTINCIDNGEIQPKIIDEPTDKFSNIAEDLHC